MATLTLEGSTSGNVVVTVPAISGTGNTITIPATTGTVLVNNSSSQTLFPDGTVSAPSISNDGDTNTGIYFPAADNVALATNGTAALTVDSNQNVSITGVIDGLSTPGVATGTGSSSGGTLAAATYYVRIVAFDSAGNTTNAGTESTGVTTTGSTSSIAYTWTAVTGATGYRVYFSTTSGTYASGYFVTTSASYTLTTTSGSFAVGLPASNTTGISLMSNQSFKRNRIINGDMRVDQRNAGAAISAATLANFGYTVDRFGFFASQSAKFSFQQNAGSVTPPAGFTNYAGLTVASAYSVTASDYFWYFTKIEGLNVSDLAWGTANAKTITLSFLVYSSLTGTFGGALQNSAQTWSYPFSYSISQANTWTQISVTITGPNASQGTWLTTNGIGILVIFGLGAGSSQSTTANAWANGNYTQPTSTVSVVGTNGATFYITGVQLEVGSAATPYERQIYSDQLAQCQRYYWKYLTLSGAYVTYSSAVAYSATQSFLSVQYPVTMRATPTISYSGSIALYNGPFYTITSFGAIYYGNNTAGINGNVAAGLVAGSAYAFLSNNDTNAYVQGSAEL